MANTESYYISSLLRSGDSKHPTVHNITTDLFLTKDEEWKWIQRYIKDNRRLPSKAAFKAQFPTFVIYGTDDLDHYTAELRKDFYRRQVINMLSEAADAVGEDDLGRAIEHINQNMSRLQKSMHNDNEIDVFMDFEGIFKEVEERAERVSAKGQAGIPTGFPTLDLATGGPQPGHVFIIAARLGAGKSYMLIKMAAAGVSAGYKVQFDSLEMSNAQVSIRIHSVLARMRLVQGIDSTGLMLGTNVNLPAYREFLEGLKKDIKGNLFVSDASRGSVGPIEIAGQIERNNPDLVLLDYMSLLKRPKNQANDMYQGVSALSSEIKNLAERYKVPIGVASQINRQGTGKEPPGAEHLSLSDSVGQDADAVLTLSRVSTSVRKCKLVKYRHGRDGQQFFIRFRPGAGDIEEISGDEADHLKEQDLLDEEGDLAAPPPKAPEVPEVKRKLRRVEKV